MRKQKGNKDISVRAIAGTRVILFGLNIPEDQHKTLLGFNIEKKKGQKYIQLHDGRTFKDKEDSLIQEFLWSDYSVFPGRQYEYKISAVHGTPDKMKEKKSVEVKINTEKNEDGPHAIFFNRGVAGSQSYINRFSDHLRWYKTDPKEENVKDIRLKEYIHPQDVPDGEAYKWLSRGLEEALLQYIKQAKDSTYKIRASLYELSHRPAAQAFIDALDRGVDVQIIHHAKRKLSYKLQRNSNAQTAIDYKDGSKSSLYKNKELVKRYNGDDVFQTAMETIGSVGVSQKSSLEGFKKLLIPRTEMSISHNKFIILIKDDKAQQVWTGSTNITGGGIYGQSNVGHVIRDEAIATQYLNYWNKLSNNPQKKSKKNDEKEAGIKNWLESHNPLIKGKPAKNSSRVVFSPRLDTKALQWYADLMKGAIESVFFTAAFSMDKSILKVAQKNKSIDRFQRYFLLEGIGGLMRDKYPLLKKSHQNRISYGDYVKGRPGSPKHEDLHEVLTGLNTHVNYIHNKFMLIDALTDDPIVVSGSANFSEASTVNNDENMLIVRGNTRLADLYLVEFMRMFTHYKRRNIMNALKKSDFEKGKHLTADSSWVLPYYEKKTPEMKDRLFWGVEI